MKKLAFLIPLIFGFGIQAQHIPLGEIAPNVHHTGKAWLNFLKISQDSTEKQVVLATFAPKSQLNWHSHNQGQQLIVLSGSGHYQEEGGPIRVMKPGDVIDCAPNVPHWHAATAVSSVSYLTIYSPTPTQWIRPLTSEEYDRSLLRTLFDEFARLADQKNVAAQMNLFTSDARVESFRDGMKNSSYQGRTEISSAFSTFLNRFDQVTHQNTVHRVEIEGDNASGFGRCIVTLVNSETSQTLLVEYHDQYKRIDNQWLIQQRISNFVTKFSDQF